MDRVAGLQAFAGTRERAPCVVVDTLDQVHVAGHIGADLVARGPHALEGSRQHARVIEDKDIAGGQVARQVSHGRVFQTAIAVHDKKPR